MKFGVSNIALPPFDHASLLHNIAELGFTGLEVAPSRVWVDTWQNLGPSQVAAYRKIVEASGLQVIGLHSLFYDHPELGLFKGGETRAQTLAFLSHLSAVCRDLGGRTLIYGGGRKRGEVPLRVAKQEAIDFMGDLTQLISNHGTCFCFEPLEPEVTDFINSALDSLKIVEMVDHPSLKVQLDAKALAANDEIEIGVFRKTSAHLVHVHANEPDMGVLGSSGKVDHREIGRLLNQIGYDLFVSIEQRMLNENDPLTDVKRSAKVLRDLYASNSK